MLFGRLGNVLVTCAAFALGCSGESSGGGAGGTPIVPTADAGSTTDAAVPGTGIEHPNFVVIMGEARGWTSTSVQQDESVADSKSKIFETPNLAALAAEGMTFADFYAPSPRCMPSRASFFSGQSPAQLHMTFIPEGNRDGDPAGNVIPPVTVTDLPNSSLTVASMLRGVGYATAHFGKWHAGRTDPTGYGFDESDGPTSNKGPNGEATPNPAQAIATTDRGLAFIDKSIASGKPFYLQISNYGGSLQSEATPESWAAESARLAGKPTPDIAEAAIIRDMDIQIGRVLQKLEQLNLTGKTYVLFTADHGRAGTTANPPLKQGKGSIWEGGVRVPLIVRGPGISRGNHSHERATQVDVLPTIAELAHVPGTLPANLEGGSLWRILATGTGTVVRSREEFVVHFPHYDKDPEGPASSIYLGDFKYVRQYENGTERLYDLGADLAEAHDLSASNPAKLQELRARLDAYLAAVNAQIPGHK